MKLEEQLEKIEKLRTDKHMQMVLLGVRCFGAFDKDSDKVLNKHLSPQDQTLNNKLRECMEDLSWKFSSRIDEFLEPASIEISMFCGLDGGGVEPYLFYRYTIGEVSLDEFIEELKQTFIDYSNTPDGHVMVREDGVLYLPEDEFHALYGDELEDEQDVNARLSTQLLDTIG